MLHDYSHMTRDSARNSAATARLKSVRFVELSGSVLTALLDEDLQGAGAEAGVALTEYFLADRAKWVWWYRLQQLASGAGTEWLTRAVVADPGDVVVGYAGFHGPPDEAHMVEIGYSVDPGHRRQGYARSILAELMRRAAAETGVRTVRVTVSPENSASLGVISGFGFVEVGQQWDDEDGLELILEVPA